MNTLNAQERVKHSQLFTVRVWVEEADDAQPEWRGTVRHVLSGETHHFREWATLIEHLQADFPAATQTHESGK